MSEGEVMANILGYAASCAVLASFLMRTMVPLRLVAILSNILFAAFGYLQNIHPVFLLHMVLLPINAWRLFALPEVVNARDRSQSPPAKPVESGTYALWLVVGLLATCASLLAYMVVANPRHV
ncbi:MAG TPA: hypothetical protein VIJ04_12300 [Xanthobacteraceae bacterium]